MQFRFSKEMLLTSLVALYIAIGPVVWFTGYSLGTLKRLFLILILVLWGVHLLKAEYRNNLSKVILIFLPLVLSLFINEASDYTNLLIGVAENIIFFMIGYQFSARNMISISFVKIIMLVLAFFCLFTISNYVLGIPKWYAPSMSLIEEKVGKAFDYSELWSTGFSWSRSGWGISLALYIPFCLMLSNINRLRKTSVFCFCIIFFSLFICGSRNALLASLIACIIMLKFLNIYKFNKLKIFKFSFFALLILICSSSYLADFFTEHLRLNQEDISSGRMDQYRLILPMIEMMGFWGLGYGESTNYLFYKLGEEHSLHNTYMKNIVEFGWLYGLTIIFFAISLFAKVFKSYKKNEENIVFWGSIIVSGLMTAMFEPGAIFGYLGGACLWWFSLGVFFHKRNNKIYNDNIEIN